MRRRSLFVFGISLVMVLLVVALVTAACGGSTATTSGASTTAGVTTSGGGTIDAAALYAQNCAGCHKDMPEGSADDVKKVIDTGKDEMPSFTDKLSADQITALVGYVVAGGK